MDTGKLDEIASKLGIMRLGKPTLIGMAALLVMVATAIWLVLPGVATTNEFELKHSEQSTDADASASKQSTVFVHVSGAVSNPGLYELEEGARVADAIAAAGGFSENALTDSCNLAKILIDGEKITIASASEEGQGDAQEQFAASDGNQPGSAGPININTATAAELESLPGIGNATAQRIIADRQTNGPFSTIEDLTRVSGIGQKKLEALSGLVCV